MHKRHYYNLTLTVLIFFATATMQGCWRGKQDTSKQAKTQFPSKGGGGTGDAATNLALGNPSNATNNTSNSDNYLLERPQYALAYNSSIGGPNWVSWHLERADLGRVPRSNNFAPDPELPPDWQVRPNDYAGSGYDRGHVCPSGDRTADPQDNDATFYMSNMLPQEGDLNRHVWEELESYCRSLVQQGNELYIVAGGYGSQGKIGRGRVNIPTNCWKIVVVLPEGVNDLARIDSGTRVIAVNMPNEAGIANDNWNKYLTSVQAIEQVTRHRFFTNVAPAVQDVLKTQTDAGRVENSSSKSLSKGNKSKRRRRDNRKRRKRRDEER